MVEKIMITPEKVRGYGNIMSQKTGADFTVTDCTLIVDTDTVNGELVTVYEMQPSTTVLSVALTVDDNSVLIGETVTLSATVEDEMFDPVSGASVSFKLNGASIGTSTTNSSGIATYTYTCNTAGTLTFSAVCMGNNSNNVNVTVTGHDYSLTFSSTSYTTNSSGDATVSAVLTDNGTVVSGATVTFTGGASTVTGTTDANGVASASVHFTSDGTLTATYSNVSDTCTVTVLTYLFLDDCSSSSGLTNYGQVVPVSSSTTTSYLEYNSTNNAYYVHANGDWGVIPITALNGADNFKITGEFKTKSSSNTYQGGFMFRAQNSTSNITFRKYGTSCNSVINDSSQQSIGSIRSANSYWHKFEITKQGRNFTVTVTDLGNDVVVGTQTRTVTFDTYYVGFMTVAGSNYGSYVRNVKAEAI